MLPDGLAVHLDREEEVRLEVLRRRDEAARVREGVRRRERIPHRRRDTGIVGVPRERRCVLRPPVAEDGRSGW